jgi:hypothetical protein
MGDSHRGRRAAVAVPSLAQAAECGAPVGFVRASGARLDPVDALRFVVSGVRAHVAASGDGARLVPVGRETCDETDAALIRLQARGLEGVIALLRAEGGSDRLPRLREHMIRVGASGCGHVDADGSFGWNVGVAPDTAVCSRARRQVVSDPVAARTLLSADPLVRAKVRLDHVTLPDDAGPRFVFVAEAVEVDDTAEPEPEPGPGQEGGGDAAAVQHGRDIR